MADLAIYRTLLRASLAGQASYRLSFGLDLLGAAFGVGLDFVEMLAVFHQVPALGGFDFDQAVLIFALASIGFALADMLVGQTDRVVDHVRTGTFDVVLLRPLSVLGQLAVAELQLRRLGRIAVSGALLGLALHRLPVDWTPARVGMLVITPLAGAVVFGSLFVVAGAATFWVVEGTELGSSFTYGSGYLSQWPVGVLGPVLSRFFTFVIPAAFTGYLPALAILGRDDPGGLPGWLPWASPLAAVLAAAGAAWLWRAGIRHYVGAGG